MKKTILFIALLAGTLGAYAQTTALHGAASYVYSPDFNQVRVGASVSLPNLLGYAGLEGRYVQDKLSIQDGGYKDPIYSVYLPLKLDFELVNFSITPFYYFKTKSSEETLRDPYAYGVNAQLQMNLRTDDVEELYTQARLQTSFARQRGVLVKNNIQEDTNYSQLAYTLSIRQNFFNIFTFLAAATAYHYPQGIKKVQSFRGILDQNDLAFTQSYDINRALSKYAFSTRITRIWAEERSTLYLGYHFAESYTTDPEHSFLLGNTFYIAQNAHIDAAYNHLQTTGRKNKRDIFYINLNFSF